MRNQYDIVIRLTTQRLSEMERGRMLNDFAHELGWHPSGHLEAPEAEPFAAAHLIVEHGLENTAVISFLRRRFHDLNYSERRALLSISYNNLVDWHIHIDSDGVAFVFNRSDPPQVVEKAPISRENFEKLRSDAFERIVGRKPSPNLPALDDALIETISYWKRNLSAELAYEISNESLSALFNAIILARAAEDNWHRLEQAREAKSEEFREPALLAAFDLHEGDGMLIRDLLKLVIHRFTGQDVPSYLFEEASLAPFDALGRATIAALLGDFYRNRYASYYDYDFSLMSKHALSRIYEHYVSILRIDEGPQTSLFPSLPAEELDRAYGNVYTPEFIARFFARYLRENTPPSMFRRITAADPACGSGIFLRMLLELVADPTQPGATSEQIESAFTNVLGIDVDTNAAHAAQLSLALLHQVLTGALPDSINIHTAHALTYFEEHPELAEGFDAVLANPPFTETVRQVQLLRDQIAEFMGVHASGRVDTYLLFLLMGVRMIKPGGLGLFVLPHSFLLGKSAAGMRKLLSEEAWIRCLVDLSSVRVFEDVGAYVILLIFQKQGPAVGLAPRAIIVRCQDLVGRALQDALEGRQTHTSFYSVYEVEQETFRQDDWILLPPEESSLRKRFERLPALEEFMTVSMGFITGSDEVFIIPAERVPQGERDIYVPVLPDRDMEVYTTPHDTGLRLFYPYLDGTRVSESILKETFPKTWEYLLSRRRELEKRAAVQKGQIPWWRPERPRSPKNMLRPKIVTPHLVLVPRFSLDREGRYAVSHSPFMYPASGGATDDLLRYFLAVLNSSACYWYISAHSHVYQHGYALLEPKTLKRTPVPDPKNVPSAVMRRLLGLVDQRLERHSGARSAIELQIDEIVADLYGLSGNERRRIGLQS